MRERVERRTALRPNGHNAAVQQAGQVLTDGRLGQPQVLGQVDHAVLATQQVLDDRDP